MTQDEVIHALENLGGKALKCDLEKEYFRLHFPPEFYGHNYYTREKKNYDIWNTMVPYVHRLKRDRIIQSRRVFIGFNLGAKKCNQVEYYLTNKQKLL